MTKGLSIVNQQQKLGEWAERVSDCRKSGLSVRAWCQENNICEQTYYRWQRRLYELAQNQQENRFAEVTPQAMNRSGIAVTVQLGDVEMAVHNGADAATTSRGGVRSIRQHSWRASGAICTRTDTQATTICRRRSPWWAAGPMRGASSTRP